MIDEIDNIYTPTQEKTVTASTSTTTVTPDTGYALSSVTINPTPSQTKSASPSTSAQTISPDSGKYLSSVSISAISPQRSSGTAATLSGRNSTGPYVYFPYGWWPNANATYGNYAYLTEAQAIAVARKQEKTVTGSRSAQTVTPDSNYVLSKVTVNKYPDASGTFNASTTRSTAIDMGATNNYRYVNTNSVSNTNSGTYTFAANDTGGTKDMGSTNTYRYVNASNVYNKGYSDGNSAGYNSGYSDGNSAGYNNGYGTAGHAINFVYSNSYDMPGAANTVGFYPTGLRANSNYCVMFFGFQISGTYTGIGSGANISPGQQGFNQKEARSDNTSGYGGMVVWAQTMFMASSSQASIIVNLVNNMRLHCEIRVMGLTS